MYKELNIRTNSDNFKVFIQDGFFSYVAPTSRPHAHSFTEIHFVMCNNSVMNIGNETVTLNSGDMVVIPKGVYHRCISDDLCTMHTAFQIDCEIDKFKIFNIGTALAGEFFKEICTLKHTNDYSKFSAFVALFVSYFNNSAPVDALEVTNPKFLIREFFSQRYSEDIQLSDLADLLHVSKRHAERLVVENMGTTFRDTLTLTRLSMAQDLISTTDMSISQIASYVGYKSYSGFWKAFKKHGMN